MDNNENTSQFRFCIKCGAPLVQGARFCPKCGAAIVRKTAAEAPAYTVIPAEAPAYTEIPADDVAAAENASAGGNGIPGIINESAGTDGSVKAELEGGIENAGAASDTADIAGEPAAAETPRTARQSVDDEFIKQMRAFEASRREQEQARRARAAAPVTREVPKEEKKRGVPGWLMAVVVVAAVLVTALFTGVVVAKIASNSQTDKASIEKIVEDYIRNNPSLSGQSGTKPGGDTSIGGEIVPGGSQVTINIEGDSTSVASAADHPRIRGPRAPLSLFLRAPASFTGRTATLSQTTTSLTTPSTTTTRSSQATRSGSIRTRRSAATTLLPSLARMPLRTLRS